MTTQRKPMSPELKAAYARYSAVDLQLADTLAQLSKLEKEAAKLKKERNEAEQERKRLATAEGYE